MSNDETLCFYYKALRNPNSTIALHMRSSAKKQPDTAASDCMACPGTNTSCGRFLSLAVEKQRVAEETGLDPQAFLDEKPKT